MTDAEDYEYVNSESSEDYENSDDEDDYSKRLEREKKETEQKEQTKKMQEEIEKAKDFRNSFCDSCGAKLEKSSFWGDYKKCKNPKCKKNDYLRAYG